MSGIEYQRHGFLLTREREPEEAAAEYIVKMVRREEHA